MPVEYHCLKCYEEFHTSVALEEQLKGIHTLTTPLEDRTQDELALDNIFENLPDFDTLADISLRCAACGKAFIDVFSLQIHVIVLHLLPVCRRCNGMFVIRENLVCHFLRAQHLK